MAPDEKTALFDGMEVRKVRENGEWYFSIVEVIAVLVGNKKPSKYWTDLKNDIITQGNTEFSDFIGKLKMKGKDGKMYPADVANTKTLLRIIQSIPSPKAEPFKQRLAQIGNERVEEFNDPELGVQRAKSRAIQVYRSKGFSDREIQTRMQGIEARRDFTKELNDRGIEGAGYGILTNIASYGWAEKTAAKYREFKGLSSTDNLRDHMTRSETLLTAIAEEATTEIVKNNDLYGFDDIQDAATKGAGVAKKTKDEFEKTTGTKIVSEYNRLTERQKQNRTKKISLPKKR